MCEPENTVQQAFQRRSSRLRSADAERVALLRDLALLGTEPDAALDAACRTAAALFSVPVALVALFGRTTVRLKARHGLKARQIARRDAICEHTLGIGAGAVFAVTDLTRDARFATNRLVVGAPHARFYAGVPLVLADNVAVGTLCLMDTAPRPDFGALEAVRLRDLGLVVEGQLRHHAARRAQEREREARDRAQERLAERETAFELVSKAHHLAQRAARFGHWRIHPRAWTVEWSEGIARIFGRPMPEDGVLDLDTHLGFYHPDDREALRQRIKATAAGSMPASGYQGRARLVRPNGEIRHVFIQGIPEVEDGGAVTTIYGVVLDMTDLAASEQQAREAVQILRTTIETMDQGLISYGPDLRVRVHNRRAQEIIDLPGHVLHDGARMQDVHRFMEARGEFADDANHMGRLIATGDIAAAPSVFERVRPDGTIMEVRGAALPSGGFVHTFTDVTQRRQAERAVQDSEARYRALADSLPQIVWIMSVETGETSYANQRFFAYFGPIGPSRAARLACLHPDDAGRIRALWQDVTGRSTAHESEVRLRRHDGVHRWHKLVMLPIRQNGDVVGMLATALDIDEIVAARGELQRTTNLLRLAQEAACAGLWEWEVASGRVLHSPESARMFHFSEGQIAAAGAVLEMSEQDWAARVRPDELPRIWQEVRHAIERRETYCCEFRLAMVDGVERWIRATARVIYDEASGQAVRFVGLHFDVTERKAAEEALRLSEERLSMALDSASDGLWDWDIPTGVVAFSEQWFVMLGYDPGEIEPHIRVWEHLVHPDDAEGSRRCFHDHLKGRTPLYESEYRLRRKCGAYAWTLARGKVVSRDPDGRALRVVGTHIDITSRKAAEQQVAHLAAHDALTGLPNRAVFRERLNQEIARAGQSGTGFAVLACDLDGFKAVNDTMGHPVGDALLRILAERLASVVGPRDTVARLGGDEFAIILSGLDGPQGASGAAQQVIEAVSRPFDLGDHVTSVGVSIGIALGPQDGMDADRLFKNADIALYRAKAAGRNTHRFYEAWMEAEVLARNLLERDLRKAVRHGGFSLHYQPIVGAATGAACGFEALMRWQHPARGMVSPAEFIPLAEETGLIVGLGAWALREACREAAAWPGSLRVAVNISAVQFAKAGLEQSVVSALSASGLPPHRLELEITESVLMSDAESVIACLHRLRALGVRIALDDFGTGYSSLSYLRRFPFDKIKIDRSFVRDIADPDTAAIVRAIVGLGERLGAGITAEGIETDDQLERVRQEGCTEVQGYLFGKPMPAADALALACPQADSVAA